MTTNQSHVRRESQQERFGLIGKKRQHDQICSHKNAEIVGGCAEGCCDDYKCPDCGKRWRVEYDG